MYGWFSCAKRLQFNYGALFRARGGGGGANSDRWVCFLDAPTRKQLQTAHSGDEALGLFVMQG